MTETFETLLCTHSAPVLAGLRPSGTVTCHREKLPFLEQDLAECRRLLLEHGLRCRVLCQCERHLVLMIYDPVWLEACLIGRRARKMLRQLGYPKDALGEDFLARQSQGQSLRQILRAG